MSLTVRPLVPGDLDVVERLEQALFGSQAWSRAALAEELDGPGRTYLAAEVDGTLVGYAGLRFDGDDADVMTIGTQTAQQGRGVGRILLRALLDQARELGARRVFLEVRVDNAAAVHLYTSEGFHRIGRRRGYYQGVDAWTMRLDLDELPGEGRSSGRGTNVLLRPSSGTSSLTNGG
ncbi:MAG: ribosomal protein S18-alanine N-acetyltransferase [Micrococcales bacterium]|nr:ribosomal protein S18-alanine N-acetyltransferase [Micrococcales bacterium]